MSTQSSAVATSTVSTTTKLDPEIVAAIEARKQRGYETICAMLADNGVRALLGNNAPNTVIDNRGKAEFAAEVAMATLERLEFHRDEYCRKDLKTSGTISDTSRFASDTAYNYRNDLERAYQDLLGKQPQILKDMPPQGSLTATELVDALAKRHAKDATAWFDWRKERLAADDIKTVWYAREGKGPGADLLHNFRSSRKGLETATIALVAEKKQSKTQEQSISR